MDNRMQRLFVWCQRVIPIVYDGNELTEYEILCKAIHYINELIVNQNNIKDVLDLHGDEIKVLQEDVKFLQEEMERVKNGDYVSLYLDSIINWIDNNLIELMERTVKFVQFTIDDEGYFNALTPIQWAESVQWDTSENGNLILEY